VSLNLKTYRIIVFILGVLGYLIYSLFANSIIIMYPDAKELKTFLSFYNGLLILSFIIGVLIRLPSLKNKLVTFGIALLLLCSILSIVSGHAFSYELKTDEFLLYFLLTALATLVFFAGFASIGRYILWKTGLKTNELIGLLLITIIGVIIGYALDLTVLNFVFRAIHLWYLITLLIVAGFIVSRREQSKITTPEF